MPGGTRSRACPSGAGHVDLGAERGLVDGDRHRQVQVVAVSAKERMRLDLDRDVEIAGLAAVTAGVSFSGDSDARAVGEPGGTLTEIASIRISNCWPPHAGHRA